MSGHTNQSLLCIAVLALAIVVPAVVSAAPPPLPVPPAGCSPPTAGRVALWRGEDSALDSVGDHDATLAGGAGYGPGIVGRSFSFPGTQDYMSVPDATALNITGDLTLDAWLRIDDENFGNPDSHGVGGSRVIFWKSDLGGGNFSYALFIEGTTGHSAASAPLGFSQGPDGSVSHVYSQNLAWKKDTWYHVAATRQGATISFYRDGIPVGSDTATQAAVATMGSDLKIGAWNPFVYYPLLGDLDEAGVWNRTLSAGEVKELHDTATGACRDTTPPDTTITGGTADKNDIKKGTPAATYTFASADPSARFECRDFDSVHRPGEDETRRVYKPCTSPYTSTLDTSKPSLYVFQVRAIDAAGNTDPEPATRTRVRHLDPKVAAVDRKPDKCRMVSIGNVRSSKRKLLPGCRLAKIVKGKVPCMNNKTAKVRRCRFGRRSGAWVKSFVGRKRRPGPRFALVGEPITLKGKRRGNWVVAAKRQGRSRGMRTVTCAKPQTVPVRKTDTAGRVPRGASLPASCLVEDMLTDYNQISAAFGTYVSLQNWADMKVCTAHNPATYPHPDTDAEYAGRGADGSFCYSHQGAALNDINGAERVSNGEYMGGELFCHMVVSNGYEVPGAKRPATRNSHPPSVNTNSYVVWRPVNPNLAIANSQPPTYDDEPWPPPEPEPSPAW